MTSVTLTIDGRDVSVPAGATVLAAARELGIAVDELQKMALPGERQLEQIETLASNMGR